MPLIWKLFRPLCLFQIIAAAIPCASALFSAFISGFSLYYIFESFAFFMVMMLANLGINLVYNNYPDQPVVDRQKKRFNWLFLINLLLLVFLFAHVFAEYSHLKALMELTGSFSKLPALVWLSFGLYVLILIFELIILYGLYELRLLLYYNFSKKEFEFEKKIAKNTFTPFLLCGYLLI